MNLPITCTLHPPQIYNLSVDPVIKKLTEYASHDKVLL